MSMLTAISSRIVTPEKLRAHRSRWTMQGQKVVFTNGCFDILHEGHLRYLADARDLGDVLVVGVNSDASVRRLKGSERPVNNETSRLLMLAGLLVVDMVVLFEEDTPLELIQIVHPDVLVKGGDWATEQIVGSSWVQGYGGEVRSLPFHQGFSTTGLIGKIRQL
ncbi:MAG: D-glycero-beta-D-manno-heptose 1-phosphate adenylyltransferase [Saprospiraceae bacterium]|nr:D-glycero-beta-D-manno-heptose 1-phosphate adenylyltransferase [Saprospiraceae bacterium]